MSVHFNCSKEIYDFLLIVRDNQLKSREEEIINTWKKISRNNNPEEEKKLDNKYHDLLNIHTENGYIIYLDKSDNEYELIYGAFDEEEQYPTQKILNLLKKDLLDLGFTGDENGIYFIS